MQTIPLVCKIWSHSIRMSEILNVWVYDSRTELRAQCLIVYNIFFIWRGTYGDEMSMLGFISYPTPPCLLRQVSHRLTRTGWTVSHRDQSVSDPTLPALQLQHQGTSSFCMGSKHQCPGLHACIESTSAADSSSYSA